MSRVRAVVRKRAALTIEVAWLRPWVYHGQHLSAAAAYSHELTASGTAGTYPFMCLVFPVIGLVMAFITAAGVWAAPAAGRSGPRPGGGGPPGPEPTPDPPGGRLTDADDEDKLTARPPSLLDQVPGSEDRREPQSLQPV